MYSMARQLSVKKYLVSATLSIQLTYIWLAIFLGGMHASI